MALLHIVIVAVVILEARTEHLLGEGLTTVDIIKSYNYPVETHHVTTEDGYILGVHRIPHGLNGTLGKKPAVLMVHGLITDSTVYVNMGPDRSLSFILADEGYDVWLFNARGTPFSKNHTNLDLKWPKDAQKYWDFSWHEIGYYDVPAVLDHVLKVTGERSVNYVGHSQGGTSFMVMTSTKPHYNKKIKHAVLMAPAILLTKSTKLSFWGVILKIGQKLLTTLRLYRFYNFRILRFYFETVCDSHLRPVRTACADILFYFIGKADKSELDRDLLPLIYSSLPMESSIRQFLHFIQVMETGIFAQYDFGEKENWKNYGQKAPPAYDLSKIKTPVGLYYALFDGYLSIDEIQQLILRLPNVARNYIVPFSPFNHMDFLFADNVVPMVYKQIVEDMKKSK